jgi:hypothetical protein
MAKFEISFKTDNAAFFFTDEDPEADPINEKARGAESARILRHVALQLLEGYVEGDCVDANGNRIGYFAFRE